MSARELTRAGVLARVAAGTLKLGSAARLMAVSYRQAKRLYRRYRQEGGAGLKHRSAGRRSNRATDEKVRKRVVALVKQKYSGDVDVRFGPTLAAEHLASEDGVAVDHETLRRWMLAEGLWSRARKRSPHRRRRERKAHFGELVQLDGSLHRWFETRGPDSCLLTLVDDATGRSAGRFSAQETIWAAVAVLHDWIETYGIPQALYTDWKNVYVRPPNAEERLTQTAPLTQFGRMCAQLGIRIIPASSPQAKGRIERNHGTHQDRLVKKLRRKGIADLTAANVFWRPSIGPSTIGGLPARQPPPTTFTWPSRAACGLMRCFGWHSPAPSRMTGWCGTTIGTSSSSARASIRRRAVPSKSSKTPPARSTFAIAIAGCAGPKSPRRPRSLSGRRCHQDRRPRHDRAAGWPIIRGDTRRSLITTRTSN